MPSFHTQSIALDKDFHVLGFNGVINATINFFIVCEM